MCAALYHQLNVTNILVVPGGTRFANLLKTLNRLFYFIMSGQKVPNAFIGTAIHIFSLQCLSNAES